MNKKLILLAFMFVEIVAFISIVAPAGVLPAYLESYEAIIFWGFAIFNIFLFAAMIH